MHAIGSIAWHKWLLGEKGSGAYGNSASVAMFLAVAAAGKPA